MSWAVGGVSFTRAHSCWNSQAGEQVSRPRPSICSEGPRVCQRRRPVGAGAPALASSCVATRPRLGCLSAPGGGAAQLKGGGWGRCGRGEALGGGDTVKTCARQPPGRSVFLGTANRTRKNDLDQGSGLEGVCQIHNTAHQPFKAPVLVITFSHHRAPLPPSRLSCSYMAADAYSNLEHMFVFVFVISTWK